MNWIESLRIAFDGVWSNKLRSGLTMLGIIIGIASVITVITLGQGGQQAILSQMEKMGANIFSVYTAYDSQEEQKDYDLTIEDAETLGKISPYIEHIVPLSNAMPTFHGPKKSMKASLTGTGADFLSIQANIHVTKGRFFNEADDKEGRSVVVLDENLAKELFGKQNPIGQRMKISQTSFVIIGLTKEDKFVFDHSRGTGYIPTRAFLSLYKDMKMVPSLMGKATSKETLEDAMRQSKQFLNRKHDHKDFYSTYSMEQSVESVNQVTGILTIVFSIIAGISLLVGGIGVMNIMLVSVTERTREIGIRKALGARRKDILIQFLIESLLVCLIGGAVGVAIGLASGAAISYFAKLPPLISWSSVLIAFGFSSAIGIFFGLYPANKAAKLDPIEALRYE
ncbi:ABC transporter permease [Brevibacillus ginsengisoli]|uniref:ABC transporter permease n=1 Tax=Brevibacillus ginsengisoli TaxID=363854 RepID=UPI003CEDFB89